MSFSDLLLPDELRRVRTELGDDSVGVVGVAMGWAVAVESSAAEKAILTKELSSGLLPLWNSGLGGMIYFIVHSGEW